MKTSKKINAGDALTAGELTDDHLGAEIELGPMEGIRTRMDLDRIEEAYANVLRLFTPEGGNRAVRVSRPVTVITPPPVVQPDKPTSLGQCIRIEGGGAFRGVVVDPGSDTPILSHLGVWYSWGDILSRAGERQIIVSDPPRWPDEDPEVPERIEEGEWKRVGRDDDPWTRGNRVESETGPKAGDVFTSLEDMPYGWIARVTLSGGGSWGGGPWGHVTRYDAQGVYSTYTHRWDGQGGFGEKPTEDWGCFPSENMISGGAEGGTTYTLVKPVKEHDARVAKDNS